LATGTKYQAMALAGPYFISGSRRWALALTRQSHMKPGTWAAIASKLSPISMLSYGVHSSAAVDRSSAAADLAGS
jgi:hypothetical protein